jgi:sterol desaturase/sphingolipid hydroxylase (fatty acid hydroxylase superfamily)
MLAFTETEYQHIYNTLSHFLPYYIGIFMVCELVYLFCTSRKLLLHETRINFISGLIVIITQASLKTFLLAGIYPSIYKYRIISIGNGLGVFIFCFFLFTFLQYVVHFLNHKVRLFWCLHEVHHSATQMNTTTGIRNSIFDIISTDALYFIIPFLGVPPLVFLIIYAGGKIWGNFIHVNEDIVSQIPVLNKVLIEPAAHHVHHAKNIIYLDKNYGEIIPLYDKLFGTYQHLSEAPVYGTLSHNNPNTFWDVQLYEFKHLIADIKNATTITDKIFYLIMPPGWAPNGQGITAKDLQMQYLK